MSRLEERYRCVLRLLPAAYRRTWEEDMVAAFLESMDTGDPETTAFAADYGRPSLKEVASVVSLAVRLRLGGTDASTRPFAWGQAVRLAVLVSMLTYAAMAVGGLAIEFWIFDRIAWLPAPPAEVTPLRPASTWHVAWNLAGHAWLPAYLALVLGHRRAAQAVAALAIAPPLLATVVAQATGDGPPLVTSWALHVIDIALVLAMAAFHDGVPAVRRRRWLLALPVGALAVPIPLFVIQVANVPARMLDWPGLCCVLLTVAIAAHLAFPAAARRHRALPWSLAFALLAAVALALRLVTLPGLASDLQRTALLFTGLLEAVALLAVSVPLAVLARRALRRLPPSAVHDPTPNAPTGGTRPTPTA